MHADDDDQFEMLANIYLSSNQAEKDILAKAFIYLCGWSLETCMKKCQTEGVQDTTQPECWDGVDAFTPACSTPTPKARTPSPTLRWF